MEGRITENGALGKSQEDTRTRKYITSDAERVR